MSEAADLRIGSVHHVTHRSQQHIPIVHVSVLEETLKQRQGELCKWIIYGLQGNQSKAQKGGH